MSGGRNGGSCEPDGFRRGADLDFFLESTLFVLRAGGEGVLYQHEVKIVRRCSLNAAKMDMKALESL